MEIELSILRTLSDEEIKERLKNNKTETFNRLIKKSCINEAEKMYVLFGRSLYNNETLVEALSTEFMIGWVRSRFSVPLEDAINAMLICSMMTMDKHYLVIMSYLQKKFVLTRSILGKTYTTILGQAVSMTNLNCIHWLHENYGISKDDMKPHEITVRNSFNEKFRGWIIKNILSENNRSGCASFCITCGSTTNIIEMGRCSWCKRVKEVVDSSKYLSNEEFEFNGIERHVQSQENYRLADRNVSIQKQDTTASTSDIERECKICMDAEVNCALVECGHMCACYTCAVKLKKCPICRVKITRVIRVYSS